MRLVDRLEDFAFPSLSTSLYCSYTVRVTAMLEDMADFWYITKTPNKTSQKHQTKQRKNTKQNTTKTPNSLLNKQEISIFATNQQQVLDLLQATTAAITHEGG